jgi:hypothetical protein
MAADIEQFTSAMRKGTKPTSPPGGITEVYEREEE